MQNAGAIFLGNTPGPARSYLGGLLAALRKRYRRLVIPCCGKFAIAGSDDPSMLKELFAELEAVEDIIESHIDPELLQLPEPQPLTDVKALLDWHVVSLIFLPASLEDFADVITRLSGDEKMLGLCDVEVLPKFRQALKRVSNVHDIRAIGAAVSKMCDIVLESLKEEQE